MKYTVEEVRARVNKAWQNHDEHGRVFITMGDAMTLVETILPERIKADESAVPVGYVMDDTATRHKFGMLTQDIPPGAELFTHLPAQAAQDDLRNSLLRGKAQNEEPRVRHLCNMGVDCEEAGICYAEANGQPEQCGRPTAEPVAQGETAPVVDLHDRIEFALRDAGFGLDEASSIAATLTHPPAQAAQSVDVEKVRRVIAHLRSFRSNTPPTWAHLDDAADNLEAAIKGDPS